MIVHVPVSFWAPCSTPLVYMSVLIVRGSTFFLLNSWKMKWIPCLFRKSLLLVMVSSIWKFIRSDLRMAFYHNLPAVWGTWVRSLRWQDPLEKGMATHSSILAWKIPWTEETGRLQSMGLLRVGHDWVNNTFSFHQPSF